MTGTVVVKDSLRYPKDMIEAANLSFEEYRYCGRDAALPLFAIQVFAFQEAGRYVPLSDLKAFFSASINRNGYKIDYRWTCERQLLWSTYNRSSIYNLYVMYQIDDCVRLRRLGNSGINQPLANSILI